MKKLKALIVALGAVAVTGSALAVPTLIISDGVTSTSLTSASGIVSYNNVSFDAGNWSVVITSGETKPALGTAASPIMDFAIQATSTGTSHNLVITFSDNSFGPTTSGMLATLTGSAIHGTGQTINFNTYYDAGNTTAATTTLLTQSGALSNPAAYNSTQTGSLSQSLYSLTEQVTITAGGGASYSLDGALAGVPDGGTTVMLLGAALSGLAVLRRKLA